ncbi:hypothetical protein [Mangrovicoccus sp. HB161399]|uniref:hypothetical protein n=1 Tax=Mangrovicoccus sp. HB161399 TaxID=2720392 RepID=UPI001557145D|nr:hypothetical protein [Mangrovicoccus sp. HB161399]
MKIREIHLYHHELPVKGKPYRMSGCEVTLLPSILVRLVGDGGLGIVILAIVLDRISQGMGQSGRERGHRHWWQGGPIRLALRLAGPKHDPAAPVPPGSPELQN